MSSFVVPIANAVKAVVAALPGAPSIVDVRKADVAHPREVPAGFSAVIITMGDDTPDILTVSGAGTDTDQGDVCKAYQIGISIYGVNFLHISSDLNTHPDFVLACKQALNKKSLAGVPSVYGTKLIQNSAWEREAFGQGNEVSRFGLLFYNAETRLGN